MTTFYDLPAEGILQVLAHLRIPDLYAFQRVCSHFHLVIKQNEAYVYRAAAIIHEYVSKTNPPTTVEEALELQRSKGWWVDNQVQTWKEFCRSWWIMDSGWTKAVVPKETCLFEYMYSFPRVFTERGLVLLQNRDLRGIFVVDPEDSPSGFYFTVIESCLVASDGEYMLFKKSTTVYTIYWQDKGFASWRRNYRPVFDEEDDDSEYSAPAPPEFARPLVDLRIDTECEALKMKDGYLMMVTSCPSLYVFDLSKALAASDTSKEVKQEKSPQTEETASKLHQLEPVVKHDLLFTVKHSETHQSAKTKCIDFDDQSIFYCTDMGVHIVCRSTFMVLYTIRGTPRQKTRQSPIRWNKRISANAYVIPLPNFIPVPQRTGATSAQQFQVANEIARLVKGTAVVRKATPWRWDVVNLHVHDGLVIVVLKSGWIVGLPDYRRLISKEWDINDGRGCWVIDLNDDLGGGTICDGRRLVIDMVREGCSSFEPKQPLT
ncbi:hypothetical protein CPB86DRAFT_785982 [Serendipita vermifera]|nr:hypothetical protein CPB86DRAFT_785982 [Serendipita vermifera]